MEENQNKDTKPETQPTLNPETPNQPPPQPQTVYITQPHHTNGIGTAGFILSILAILLMWVPFIGQILWFLGLVFSFVGVFKKPKGLAIAGLVISLLGIILMTTVMGILMAAVGFSK